jgi:S1-C subfamily serine protease
MRSTRLFVLGIFVIGLIAGILLAVYVLVLPRDLPTDAQAIPTAAPTPMLPDDAVLAQVDALDQVIVNLYQRVSPSVVHIASRHEVVTFFYGVIPQEGTGSGFVYDGDGHIVTNHHVVANAAAVDVLLSNGVTLPAQVIGVDAYYDLAVLRVDVPSGALVPLELGDSSRLQVGQTVVAIGNPFGLDRTLTTGVISALERRIETSAGTAIGQAIQTDAAINPGNSGGPLLDTRGRVVGINTAINSPTGASVGIGFAVPVNIVKRVVPSLIADGRYLHPSLDIEVAELGREVIPSQDSVQNGLLIVRVYPGGAAEKAGLQPASVGVRRGRYVFSGGDIITEVGGEPIATRDDLLLALESSYRPGDEVILTLVRNGQTITVPVILGGQ